MEKIELDIILAMRMKKYLSNLIKENKSLSFIDVFVLNTYVYDLGDAIQKWGEQDHDCKNSQDDGCSFCAEKD